MPSLRDIRRKIKSVKSTQQITKAMKMIAAARLRRAQARIMAARPYAQKMDEILSDATRYGTGEIRHPLLMPRPGDRRILLLITADKGSCGAFNSSAIRETLRYLHRYGSDNVSLFVVGKKGRDYFRRIGVTLAKEYVMIFNDLSFAQAAIIGGDLLLAYGYDSGGPVAVDVIYNEFVSVVQQKVVTRSLFPLPRGTPDGKREMVDFLYEPPVEEMLGALIDRFFKAQVYRMLLESAAAEQGARMAAMDNASHNAEDLIGSLTLTMNRTRQAAITKEILEVVSGAEVLK